MSEKLTKKQKFLASLIRVHRKELLKRFIPSRLGMYMSGERIPDYDTALYIAKLAEINVDEIAYRKLNK